MATVNLGSIKFKWKGTYAGGTAYTIDDVVSYNGSSYICIQASTGNLPTDTAYFEQMSSAGTDGTDGTDVGTTITTQGDILYRDASGLARLGAGTSGQALITNGTGANPSWGDVSSGELKFISSHTITSDTSLWTLDNVFDNTNHDHYVINVNNISHNNNTVTDTWFGLRNSSGSNISNTVQQARIRNNAGGNGFSAQTMSDGYQRIEHSGASGNTATRVGNYKIYVYNASQKRSDGTANTFHTYTNIHYVSSFDHSVSITHGFSVGRWETTTSPATGFALQRSGFNIIGSVTKPKVDIFGVIKQS
jgi:hypothetical protein